MGYRNYIGKISKENYEKIKDLSPSELDKHLGKESDNEDDHYYFSKKDLGIKELHELGKYFDHCGADLLTDFFTNKETNELFHNSDAEFQLVKDKKFLALIIEEYKEKIKRIYEGLLKDYDRHDLSKLTKLQVMEAFNHISGMAIEWTHLTPYDLEKPDEITGSWKYEYAIFELVSIYKKFDSENEVMVYWGG